MAKKIIKLFGRLAHRVSFWLIWSACGVGIECTLTRNVAGEIETAAEMLIATVAWCILERLEPWLQR